MSKVQLNVQAPDFTLNDIHKQPVTLSGFRGKKHVVLVFNRGFFWPFCRRHMAQLRQEYQKFVEKDAEIVVVGPENAREFEKYWSKEKLPFIGLPDPKHIVLDLYGQEVKLLKLGRMPAQVIIGKQGVVRFAHYGNSMQDIPTNDELLELLDQLNREQQ